MSSSLKLETIFALGIVRAHILGSLRRKGGNISVDLSLFALLFNIYFRKKFKFNDLKKLKS